MPVIFIHGVNTRDTDESYEKDVAARNDLLRRRVLEPLSTKAQKFANLDIVNVYWGKYGVEFKWNLSSLPEVKTLEHLGAEDGATPQSDLEIAQTIDQLSGGGNANSRRLEGLGTGDTVIKDAALKDLNRFLETMIMSPLISSEMRLAGDAAVAADQEGILQASLAIAAREVANDPGTRALISACANDDEVLDVLRREVLIRFDRAMEDRLTTEEHPDSAGTKLESLGPEWFDNVKDRVGELFSRVKDIPGRVVTVPALDRWREGLHQRFARFTGDVFIYLNERGDRANPGPIVEAVSEGLKTPKHVPEEPLIVITHSMGGNILYDVLTYYAPDLKVDFWASVGGQVAQFEEMKIFKASDKSVGPPAKVVGLRPKLGYWLNVYDPVDTVSFKAAPVFGEVNADVEYLTGASAFKSHGQYFGRASFYDVLREHIEKALV